MAETVVILAFLALPWYIMRPGRGMLVLLVAQSFALGGSLEVTSIKLLFGLLFGICCLAWFPLALKDLRTSWSSPVVKALFALFALFALSRVVGASHGISATDWFRDLSPMLPYAWILLGVPMLRRQGSARELLVVAVWVVFALSIPTLLQWLFFRSVLESATPIGDAVSSSPVLFLVGSFLSLALAVSTNNRREAGGFTLLLASFILFTFLAGNRMELLSIFVGVAISVLLLVRRRDLPGYLVLRVAALTGCIIVFGAAAFLVSGGLEGSALLDRYVGAGTKDMMEDPTLTNRIAETLDAWNAFQSDPLLGKGLGYRTETPFQVGTVSYIPEYYFIHNFYAYVLAKFGLVGAVVVAWFFWKIVRVARRCFLQGDRFTRAYMAAIIGMVISSLILSVSSNQFVDRTWVGLMGYLIGIQVAMSLGEVPSQSATSQGAVLGA